MQKFGLLVNTDLILLFEKLCSKCSLMVLMLVYVWWHHIEPVHQSNCWGYQEFDHPLLELPPTSPYEHHLTPASKHPNHTNFRVGATWPPLYLVRFEHCIELILRLDRIKSFKLQSFHGLNHTDATSTSSNELVHLPEYNFLMFVVYCRLCCSPVKFFEFLV